MNKYDTLVRILDVLRKEAPDNYKFYHPLESDEINLNKARARAYIHLYLKVKFGLLTFKEREKYVTDDPNDGGIDGYYIDKELKKIYFIQSKFRNSKDTFESREIKFEELISMDIERITEGEEVDENGISYNGKILSLIKELKEIPDIGRYKYEIVIIANTKDVTQNKLRKLSDGNPVIEINFEKAYNELVFPIISGTFYNQSELIIQLNLHDKDAKNINYSVDTEFKDCEISIVFVPTIEIAKILYKYKNSILKYNPRSYLEMARGTVNYEIADTIKTKKTNEFALYNNGITILSDETHLNKKVAKKGIGQLILTNPQIINGGQTAYTLSNIYQDVLDNKIDENVFYNKEVLLKIITFSEDKDERENNKNKKLELIEAISKATNQQTVVTEADRRSNDKIQIDLQNLIFEEYGLFYQRKAGEFGEGLKYKYITRNNIIDRELLLRLALACDSKPAQARRTGGAALFKKSNFDNILISTSKYKDYINAYFAYLKLIEIQSTYKDDKNNKDGIINFGYALRYGKYAVISVIMQKYTNSYKEEIELAVDEVLSKWNSFEEKVSKINTNYNYFREIQDSETGKVRQILNFDGYYKGTTLNSQIKLFNEQE